MFSTVVFVAALVGILLALTILWAWLLRLGLRRAKVQDATTKRIVFATAVVIILEVAMTALFHLVSPSSDAQSIALGLANLAAAVTATLRRSDNANTRPRLLSTASMKTQVCRGFNCVPSSAASKGDLASGRWSRTR